MEKIKTAFSHPRFPAVILLLVFVPLFFHGPRFGIPYVKGGDEPHYLAMINSLLIDGNLDLRNSYDSARKGSWRIGKKFAGAAVDAHVDWNVGGRQVTWPQVYEDPNQWKKGADGYYVPERRPDVTVDISNLPEYSGHPAGIAFLLAPFLWPFRGTPLTEPMALLCSNLAVLLSVFLFRGILRRYTQDRLALNLATLLAFLGTPIWAYARTLFMEPYLIFFATAAYFLVLEKRSGFWAGISLGLGALLKPNFLILSLPLACFLVYKRKFKSLGLLAIGPCLATAAVLYSNFLWYGSPFTPPQPFWFGNPLHGLVGLLFSWNHGIFTFMPAALLALAAWPRFLRDHGSEAVLIGSGFLVYFIMMALYGCWWGGWCYGPRLVAPVLLFLMAPIFHLPGIYSPLGKPLRLLAVVICVASLAFNALGAMDGYWDSHPLTIFAGNIS